jgi:hypothetical protein
MKTVAIAALAVMLGTSAMAQSSSTTIQREDGPLGDRTTVIKKENDDGVTTRSRVDTGVTGCDTKSVTRTNDEGDSKTKTVTRC